MTIKTILATAALALAPVMGAASCAGKAHEEVTMSCPTGSTYDSESRSCVDVAA